MSLESSPYIDVIRQSGRDVGIRIDSEDDAVCPWIVSLYVDLMCHKVDYVDDLSDATQAIEDWCREYVEEHGL